LLAHGHQRDGALNPGLTPQLATAAENARSAARGADK